MKFPVEICATARKSRAAEHPGTLPHALLLSTRIEHDRLKRRVKQRIDATFVGEDRDGPCVAEQVGVDPGPVDQPAGLGRQLVEERKLTTGVDVAEGMDNREFTPGPRQAA